MFRKPTRHSVATVAVVLGTSLSLVGQTAPPQATTVSALTPAALAYDAAGNLYIAVRAENVVRRVDTLGQVTTVAGTGEQGFSGDGGPATQADLDAPSGVAVDANGTLYIADSHNHRVRTVTNGFIQTLAGTGVAGFSGDSGPAAAAQLDLPSALSIDASGNLYIADTLNERIRRISAGVITTFAGTGEQGYGGDGAAATAAQLDSPTGVSVDPTTPGQVYIGDTDNQRIRKVAANGIITTLAGAGVAGFAGDGGAAAAAVLDRPKGLGVRADGAVYLADSQNERIRLVAGGNISTVAGDGEQGFAGDLGLPTAAVLDTPWAVAPGASGTFALTDTHNQRVRAANGTAINTVAGVPPPASEGLVLSGPTTGVYGATTGQLTATFSNGTNTASGSATLTDNGTNIGSATLAGNLATFNLSALSGGLHSLVVSYGGDGANPAIASGVYVVQIAAAAQTVAFTSSGATLTYSPGLTATVAATATSGLPVGYTVSGPATLSGSTLTITGPGTITLTATQTGDADFAAASQTQQIIVKAASLVAAGVDPSSVTLGASNTTLVVTGSGFTTTSTIEVNGTALPTTFVNFNEVTAILPQVSSLADLAVTVVDPTTQSASSALDLKVATPSANASLQVPNTSSSGQQPTISLEIGAAYPVPLLGTLNLSFQPYGTSGATDPALQFSTGGVTAPISIPANSTATQTFGLATGTLAGTITLNFDLTADGVNVTPAGLSAQTITIPPQVPQIAGGHVSFTQSGATLTVTVSGFSNVRDMSQAIFSFTPAPGSSLATSSLTVPVADLFGNWFSSAASLSDGSNFTYTQTFTLSDPSAVVSGVSVQLVNSVGASPEAVSQ